MVEGGSMIGFRYVDRKTPGFTGAINLFFDHRILCLTSDPELARNIKKYIDENEPSVQADAQQRCGMCDSEKVQGHNFCNLCGRYLRTD